jgi:hypothetical protein
MPNIIFADYKNILTPYPKEKGKYYCPACGGHNLSFSHQGKWNCWNNPTREHRLEIIAQIIPDFNYFTPQLSQKLPTIIPPIKIQTERLHLPIIKPQNLSETIDNRTTHNYSDCQRVVRHDYRNHKIIYLQHFNGKYWVNGAGDRPWIPFGLERLFPYPGAVNLVLLVEGQKCVEIAHSRGIPALCLEGGDYSCLTIAPKLEQIHQKLKPLLLVVLPDNDPTGTYKANHIWQVANRVKIPVKILDPLQLQPNLIPGGDIEQIPHLNGSSLLEIVAAVPPVTRYI